MVVDGVVTRNKRWGPQAQGVGRGKKAKVPQRHAGASHSGGSDDDFVSPPLAFLARLEQDPVWNVPDGELTAEEDAAFPRIKTRSCAGVLVDALQDLSCQQKDDIGDMGFASLLDFGITGCPARLVHWLLPNFDDETRSFDLGGGRVLALEKRDVELVLGFPRGHIDMVKRDKLDVSNLLKKWRGKFEKARHMVTPSEISTVMVGRVDGAFGSGVISVAWKSGAHKVFVGPAEFVALFYVDRVMHLARSIPRLIPTFRGWSFELLEQRELSEIRLGGFGLGVIEPQNEAGGHVGVGGAPTPQVPEEGDGVCSSPGSAIEYGRKTIDELVVEHTTIMARSILQLSQLFKYAREGGSGGDLCRQMCEALQLLVGGQPQPSSLDLEGVLPSQPTFSQREDMFWSNAENLRAIEDIERAISERNELFDVPSFSLGFTQEFGDAVQGVVDDIARDYGAAGVVAEVNPVDPSVVAPAEGVCPANTLADGDGEVAPANVDSHLGDPVVATPFEVLDGRSGVDPGRSDGPVCAALVKLLGLSCHLQSSGQSQPVIASLLDLPEDAVVVNWLLAGSGANIEEILVSIDGRVARCDDLLTLVPGSQVGCAIIDVWSSILNCREHTKELGAPSRFFASTFTTLHTVVDTSQSRNRTVELFRERLYVDLESSLYSDFKEVDLMFFPILRREHYFLVCFDFRRFRMEVIDNNPSPAATKNKYGESLVDMQDMLSEFFTKVHPRRSVLCDRVVPKRMQMHWQNFKNKTDCGVYLMRHMKTFMGQGVSDWECGLAKGDSGMLKNSGCST
nr:uncharacterized protein LOC109168900 [Ipomoea batatas]